MMSKSHAASHLLEAIKSLGSWFDRLSTAKTFGVGPSSSFQSPTPTSYHTRQQIQGRTCAFDATSPPAIPRHEPLSSLAPLENGSNHKSRRIDRPVLLRIRANKNPADARISRVG